MSNDFEQLNRDSDLFRQFYKKLSEPEIKVVSFDLFETVLFRKVFDKNDIFLKMGRKQAIKRIYTHPSSFMHYRVEAEKKARQQTSREEIRLKDIYQELGLNKQVTLKFMKLECKLEKSNRLLNKQILQWMQLAKKSGKKIIISSDMYLSKKQIKYILPTSFHVELVDRIYVSSDYNKTKFQGNLFELILKDFDIKPKQLLHIGDHPVSDVQVPERMGIKSIHYSPSEHERERWELELGYIGNKVMYGKVLRYLSALLSPYDKDSNNDFYFKLGASVFGPVLWEFSHWLLKIAKQKKVKQINLLMREGRIFYRCLLLLLKYKKQTKPQINLIYASRKSTLLPALSEHEISNNQIHFYRYRHLSIGDFYELLGLKSTLDEGYLNQSLFQAEQIKAGDISLSNLVADELQLNKELILEQHIKAKQNFRDYCQQLGVESNSLLVDFGSGGTSLSHISRALEEQSFTPVLFYMNSDVFLKTPRKQVLSFFPLTESNHHSIELLRRSPDILENLFNASEATTIDYSRVADKVTPVTRSSQMAANLTECYQAFDRGVDAFFSTAMQNGIKSRVFSTNTLIKMIGRLIEIPTKKEAMILGELPYDDGYAANSSHCLIDEDKEKYAMQQGVQKLFENINRDLSSHYHILPWVHGVISRLDGNYIAEQKQLIKQSIHQRSIHQLLTRLNSYISQQRAPLSLSIYGTGDFFDALYPYLLERNIHINYLVDSNAASFPFVKLGYQVLSPQQALDKGERIFLIASVVFANEMICTLESSRKKTSELIVISKQTSQIE